LWIIVCAIALPWAALAILSRDYLPIGRSWIDFLFAATLVATYIGVCAAIITLSRDRRRSRSRAAAASLGVVVAIAMLEVPAVLRWIDWTWVFRQALGEGFDYQTTFVRDKQLGYRRIPKLRWSGRPYSDIEESYAVGRSLQQPITFTYDRWGYRNASDMEQADVVLLGDSYVEGWYVSDEQTVAAQLAARIRRPVANLGVAGYGTLQELRVLKSDALTRRPSVAAWVFFEGNDLYDDESFEALMKGPPPADEDLRPHREGTDRHQSWAGRSFVTNALRRVRRLVDPLVVYRAPYWAWFRSSSREPVPIYFFRYAAIPWSNYEEGRWKIARAALEEGTAFARERGIHIVFLYAPIKFRVFQDFVQIPDGSPMKNWHAWESLPRYFQDFCEASKVECVDLTEGFKRTIRNGRLPYPLSDTHWSADGHAVAAEALEDVIVKHAWLNGERAR
jgi:lysophospholipase L1-like esterase